MNFKFLSTLLMLVALTLVASCSNDNGKSQINAYFTPGENCSNHIVEVINQAKKSLSIQSTGLSDPAIINAVLGAKQRGVDVRVIFDKFVESEPNSPAVSLKQHGITVWIDDKVALAHNNVMIIDDTKVITGSFNYTPDAQEKNAENLLIIDEPAIAKRYLDNWQSRVVLSHAMTEDKTDQADQTKLAQNKHHAAGTKKKNRKYRVFAKSFF